MAGGFGTRLRPLTTSLPKPMLPLLNRPLLLHVVEHLKRHGLRKLLFLLHHRASHIQRFFGDGHRFGVKIDYCVTTSDLGTAGATGAARELLKEPFVLLSGDVLTDLNLSEVIRRHNTLGATASMVLTRAENPCPFGIVAVDHQERVVQFKEKPTQDEVFSDLINSGIYVLDPQVFELIPPDQPCDWAGDVFPRLLKQSAPLYGLFSDCYWRDIGTPQAYLHACQDIYSGKIALDPRLPLPPAQHDHAAITPPSSGRAKGCIWVAENCRIAPSAHLTNVVIGRNCIIEAGCHLENTILWDHVHLRHNSRIRGAILGNHVVTGMDVRIDTGAIIADHARLGAGLYVPPDTLVKSPHPLTGHPDNHAKQIVSATARMKHSP
mgnify:CR=1 FL=1